MQIERLRSWEQAWDSRPEGPIYRERFDGIARYALIVTIRAPGSEVDIVTPEEAAVTIQTAVET